MLKEALTMPVTCKVDLSYNRTLTKSLSTVYNSGKGSFFLLAVSFPRYMLLEEQKAQVLRTFVPVQLGLGLNESKFVRLVTAKNT